jgi:uncharacterized lipoprotein NlpE involved in copper resistance
MKKLMMLTAFVAAIGFAACGQNLAASKVPAAVKAAFAKKFAGAVAEWGKENSKEYEAEFKFNGNSASANFLTDGSWVETEMEIALQEVPAAVTTAIKTAHPAAVITKVYKIDNAKGELTYEAEIKTGNKKQEMVLKADGTIVK